MKMSGSVRKVHQKGQQTRALVLETSIHIFAQKSYHSSTVEDIAKAAGLAKGTLYQYYKSKKDLLLACLQQWQSNMDLGLAEVVTDESLRDAKSFKALVTQSLDQFFDLYAQNFLLLKVLSTTKEKGVDIDRVVQQSFYRLVKNFEHIFHQGRSAGLIQSELPAAVLAFHVVALAYQLAYQNFIVEAKPASTALAKSCGQFIVSGLNLRV